MNRLTTKQRFYLRCTLGPNGCWIWIGGIDHEGYGDFSVGQRGVRAHRFAYELYRGKIRKGRVLDHLCRVRHCVNPEHLEVVTKRENAMRGESPSVVNSRKTHCVLGHEFNRKNTLWSPKHPQKGGARPRRICRHCKRLQRRAYVRGMKFCKEVADQMELLERA